RPAPAAPAPAAPAPTAAAAPATATPRPVATAPVSPATPKRGGRLIELLGANIPSLDVQQESTVNTDVGVAPVYNRIVQYDTETSSKIVADLAESWDISPDGKVYTLRIRQGVTFHDGSPLTADDIAFNLQRLITPPQGVASRYGPLLRPSFDKVVKVDDRTVQLQLKTPLAMTMAVLTTGSTSMYPRKVVEAKGGMKTDAVGTGPFKLESYTPAVGVELVRNPSYFVSGRPYLDRLSIRIVTDAATRLAAMRTGQAHMTARVFTTLTPGEMESLKATTPAMQFFSSPSPLGPAFSMNTRRPPFDDVRVRKAVSLALDRQAAIKILAEGQGAIGKLIFFGDWGVPADEIKTWPGFRPKDTPGGQEDVATAKKLMIDAGYPDGFDLEILSRTNRITQTSATFMTEQLRTLNIRARLRVLEDASFFDSAQRGQFQAVVYTPVYSTPDPGVIVSNYLTPGGSLNYSHDKDDRLKQLNDAQLGTVREDERRRLIREAEEYATKDLVGLMPMVWPYTFIAVAPQVRNFKSGISDYVHNGNLFEVLWMDQ
ncbi:MAG: ABC transporter substrate-binding protein, partial [Dehalococcoidia bacterium]|nr:ABC transporter substrate-binding protein [Dehalococcoidia bacterium]